jgi:hypothetical protein
MWLVQHHEVRESAKYINSLGNEASAISRRFGILSRTGCRLMQ